MKASNGQNSNIESEKCPQESFKRTKVKLHKQEVSVRMLQTDKTRAPKARSVRKKSRPAKRTKPNFESEKCPYESFKRTKPEHRKREVSPRKPQTDKSQASQARSVRKKASNGQNPSTESEKCPQASLKRTKVKLHKREVSVTKAASYGQTNPVKSPSAVKSLPEMQKVFFLRNQLQKY